MDMCSWMWKCIIRLRFIFRIMYKVDQFKVHVVFPKELFYLYACSEEVRNALMLYMIMLGWRAIEHMVFFVVYIYHVNFYFYI